MARNLESVLRDLEMDMGRDGLGALAHGLESCQDEIRSLQQQQQGSLLVVALEKVEEEILVFMEAETKSFNAINELTQMVASQQTKLAGAIGIGLTPQSELNRALISHFIHQGLVDAASTFARESKTPVDEQIFQRARQGLAAMECLARDASLEGAIQWLMESPHSARARENELLFSLHRARFLQLAQATTAAAALEYARVHLAAFASRDKYSRDVEALVTSAVLFPATTRLAPATQELKQLHDAFQTCFRQEYTSLSPVLDSGARAARDFCKFHTQVGLDWTQTQLCIPLSNDSNRRAYHTEVVCPISGETDSADNPPMMLSCGHVFLWESIRRLASRRTVFKCPTCPKELTLAEVTRIRF